ncbi:MAG: hypothetical protein DKM50_02160 [Candidatus Margulisiibacteriota bacterium]|nr:MAG: hypothetical protein A2X43_06620 [Candidatus Margulisbacteria bacterium GWD2_39_127]OGI05307.1 MAG: hypothetical protein A2X42_03865 [Candidatus Margulisbacteria bacterium GWF2_38_17]OGI10834.1 MAG: hypothetical protein A2X41_05610 [Candidatus Margulisbacteria bacterium GWE2_39_32]PZM83520.1 MAG: hypothetical protein DKM50_02160 [Candidatus Margulisiibacteriota bacterium]HAR64303.1 hypothetical protein [Candidatus Margulisiibacteriota bacterium]
MLRKIGKPLLILLFLLTFVGMAYSEVNVAASLSTDEISLDGSVVLTLTLEGDVGNIDLPDLPKLDKLSVMNTSQSSQFSWINGKISSSKQFQYTLAPREAGTIKIPSFQFTIANKNYQTKELVLKVVSSGQSRAVISPSSVQQNTRGSNASMPEVFLESSVSKRDPYVGEQIIYKAKFYRRIRIFGDVSYRPPLFKGFVTYPLDKDKSTRTYQETRGNHDYIVDEVRAIIVPAYQTNAISIDPAKVTLQMSYFDPAQEVLSKPLTIMVLPLPSVSQGNARGGIGDYRFSVSVDATKVAVGDVINAVVEVEGEGNVKDVMLPELVLPEDIKKFDSKESVDVKVDGDKLRGVKKASIILIPGVAGTYKLDPVSFTYFSVSKKKYITSAIDMPAITVIKGSGNNKQTADSSGLVNKKTINELKEDLNYIKETSRLEPVASFNQSLFFKLSLLFGISVLFINILYLFAKHLRYKNSDSLRMRNAVSKGLGILQKARKPMKENTPAEFYLLINEAVTIAVADKFGVSSQGLTKTEIVDKCSGLGVPQEVIKKLISILDLCDISRYGGKNSHNNELQEMYNETRMVLTEIDKYFRR